MWWRKGCGGRDYALPPRLRAYIRVHAGRRGGAGVAGLVRRLDCGATVNIYVASSWRNAQQPEVVRALRAAGHVVYDFRNPLPGDHGFSWRQVQTSPRPWTIQQYREALAHPVAERGYGLDITGLRICKVCVLVLPAGRSACWELGYAMGEGKRGIVLHPDGEEPELMFREATIVANVGELLEALR